MLRKGIAAAPGISIGQAVVKRDDSIFFMRRTMEQTQVEQEVLRFRKAIQDTNDDLEQLKQKVRREVGEAEAEIFAAHQMFLEDPEFIQPILEKMKSECLNVEAALADVRDSIVAIFESMDDAYMRERAADLRDVCSRLLKKLLNVQEFAVEGGDGPIILVVHDLSPSDTAQLNKQRVKGFVTNIGGRTSHSAIMAKTLGIPAVVGLSKITGEIQTGDLVIVDGYAGEVHIAPDKETLAAYERRIMQNQKQLEVLNILTDQPTVTKDQHQVELEANIGNPQDAAQLMDYGAQGVGLFRTEFLFMGRADFPTEEEQFAAYKTAVQHLKIGQQMIIRTLDIGGDKELPYLTLPEEMNPFLGYRAIRLCLDRLEVFKTQLRAILRASVFGNIKLMYPMIATLTELRKANQVLEDAKQELYRDNIPFNENLEVGIMIEVPAAAIVADLLAKEVDFFSIGTNDLIQYTLAADRLNEHVSYLYDPFHPAVLRLIRQVIQAAHQEGKRVGMCGEMAGDLTAIPILLGLGLDEFSMSAASILRARHLIQQLEYDRLCEMIPVIFSFESGEQIKDYIKEKILPANFNV